MGGGSAGRCNGCFFGKGAQIALPARACDSRCHRMQSAKYRRNQSKFRSWEVGLGQGQWCTKVARMIGSGSCSKHWRQQKKNNDCREKRRQASKAKREETRNQKRSRGEATSQSRPRQGHPRLTASSPSPTQAERASPEVHSK